MAKAPATPARTPVTERGGDLLALIAASPTGYLMLTQDEGREIVDGGFAVLLENVAAVGETAAIALTDSGKASVTSDDSAPNAAVENAGGAAVQTAAPAVVTSKGFAIESGVPLPSATARRGRQSGYPFEKLGINDSFHVAKPDDVETLEELLTRLQSSVSGARAKFAVQDGDKTKTVKQKTYKKDDNDKIMKDEQGKRILDTETEVEVPVMLNTRNFTAMIVGDDDPKGEGVRVWRIADEA